MLARPFLTAGIVVAGVVELSVQTALPLYGFVRWGLVAPFAGLVVATAVVLLTFAEKYPETDALGFYAFFVGPILLGVTVALGLLELGAQLAAG
ncbi:hypothetical protein [Halomarina rubra]|uniref:Uncharacterized protein n=1 Tax=Halomarina rubra TaxID=2071873 RepID=A0ABD6ATY1_9EURY|nr:hypothetical protein [Halomarina rubra]